MIGGLPLSVVAGFSGRRCHAHAHSDGGGNCDGSKS
jgi:hypothetical protein